MFMDLNIDCFVRAVNKLNNKKTRNPLHWDRIHVYRASLLQFDARWSYFHTVGDDCVSFHRSAEFQILLCGNTHTFFQEQTTNYRHRGSDWEHLSSHDSCWVNSINDRLTRLYFSKCEEIENEFMNDYPNLYQDTHWMPKLVETRLYLRSDLDRLVWAHIKGDPDDQYSYRRILHNVDTDNRIVDEEKIGF